MNAVHPLGHEKKYITSRPKLQSSGHKSGACDFPTCSSAGLSRKTGAAYYSIAWLIRGRAKDSACRQIWACLLLILHTSPLFFEEVPLDAAQLECVQVDSPAWPLLDSQEIVATTDQPAANNATIDRNSYARTNQIEKISHVGASFSRVSAILWLVPIQVLLDGLRDDLALAVQRSRFADDVCLQPSVQLICNERSNAFHGIDVLALRFKNISLQLHLRAETLKYNDDALTY